MGDVLLVLVVLGFFALSAVYVRACDRLIASDGVADPADSEPDGVRIERSER